MDHDDDFDLDDLLGDPNGPAYTKLERRTGVPLDYVAEKLRRSLELTHLVFGSADAPADRRSPGWAAVRYGVVAFLALHNMLAMANDESLFDRLLALPAEDFGNWLDTVEGAGSVSG